MPRAPSPRRYAQAVYQIALEREEPDTWVEDLQAMAAALEDRDLLELLDAPQVPAAHKTRAIGQVIGDSVEPLALNLVSLLATRGQAHLLPGILEQYVRLLDRHRGVERAEVVSAVPLPADRRDAIAGVLEALVNKRVQLVSIVDPQVLGGFIARVGDQVVDGSVRTRLKEMRRSIVEQVSS